MTDAKTSKDIGDQKVQILSDFANSDLTEPRLEYVFRTPFLATQLEKLLVDKRDMPMICLQLNIIEYITMGASILYYINMMENPPALWIRNLLGLLYVVGNTALFEERFILMLHYQSHRPIFRRDLDFLNSYVNWVMAPFFGIPCGVYKLHHVVMHHVENNHALDISSTETYQRDSLLHFLMYYIRFAALIYVELPIYCCKTQRWESLRTITMAITTWAVTITLLAKYVNYLATFWILMVPVFVAFLAMAFGNWSQHIFVDPTRPDINYALTYNCIDTFVNRRTFNDGYHVIHHYNARMHWSELPEHFHSEVAQKKHQEEGAITFRNIHFFDVGIYVMAGKLQKLAANHYVHLGSRETAPTVKEVEAKLRGWLVKMPAHHGKKKVA